MMILRGGDDNDGEQQEEDGDEEDLSNVKITSFSQCANVYLETCVSVNSPTRPEQKLRTSLI